MGELIVRILSRRKLGKGLTICGAIVEGGEFVGEAIDVVASGEEHAKVFACASPRHAISRYEIEDVRNRQGRRVVRVVEYGGKVEEPAKRPLLPKAERARVFASWLAEHLGGIGALRVIVDVAGGRGDLASALLRLGVTEKATVVDPQARTEVDVPAIRSFFEFPCGDAVLRDVLRDATAIVALHPDEATEAAVCVAAQRGLPFAVVPCCVFPGAFAQRRQFWRFDPENRLRGVRTYDTFVRYLVERAKALGALDVRTGELELQGKNVVIYSTGRSPRSGAALDGDSARSVLSFLDVVEDVVLDGAARAVDRAWRYVSRTLVKDRLDVVVAALRDAVAESSFYDVRVVVADAREVVGGGSHFARLATATELRAALSDEERLPLAAAVGPIKSRRALRLVAAIHDAVKGPAYLGKRVESHPHDQRQVSLLYCERAKLAVVVARAIV